MRNRISIANLRRNRGYALVFAFVFATSIETLVHWRAQPDVMWMSMMAASMYLLFEAGLFIAGFFLKG